MVRRGSHWTGPCRCDVGSTSCLIYASLQQQLIDQKSRCSYEVQPEVREYRDRFGRAFILLPQPTHSYHPFTCSTAVGCRRRGRSGFGAGDALETLGGIALIMGRRPGHRLTIVCSPVESASLDASSCDRAFDA